MYIAEPLSYTVLFSKLVWNRFIRPYESTAIAPPMDDELLSNVQLVHSNELDELTYTPPPSFAVFAENRRFWPV